MALASYTDLKTAIADWMVRSDLGTAVDDFIDLAEELFCLEPQPPTSAQLGGVRHAITTETGTLTVSQDYIAKPSDLRAPLSLDLTGDTGCRLEYLATDAMPLRQRTGTGQPKFWTVTDNIDFDVAPDSAYAYELKYFSGVTALSTSNTSNAILTNHPSVYLSACLYYGYDYIGDDDNANKWLARYKAYAWGASQSFRAQNISLGSIASKVA